MASIEPRLMESSESSEDLRDSESSMLDLLEPGMSWGSEMRSMLACFRRCGRVTVLLDRIRGYKQDEGCLGAAMHNASGVEQMDLLVMKGACPSETLIVPRQTLRQNKAAYVT
jgi:hypothetical protein